MTLKGLFSKKGKSPSAAPRSKEERASLLLQEYKRVFALFRQHPYIGIREVTGVPPVKYYVAYNVDGLVQHGKSIESKNMHIVEITLPPGFPDESPQALMPQPAFHPNISAAEIDIKDLWLESPKLADCIVGIGKMIAFQRYNVDAPLCSEAAQWAMRNKSLLPLFNADLDYKEPPSAPGSAPGSSSGPFDQPTARIMEEEKTKIISSNDDTEAIAAGRQEKKQPESTALPAKEGRASTPRQDGAEPRQPDKPVESAAPEKIMGARHGEKSPDAGKEPVGPRATGAPSQVICPAQPATVSATANIDGKKMASVKQAPAAASYCPVCGTQNAAMANYCVRCGTKLAAKSSQRIVKLFYLIGMIAIPVIILEMGVIIVLLNKKGPEFKVVAPANAHAVRAQAAPMAEEPRQPAEMATAARPVAPAASDTAAPTAVTPMEKPSPAKQARPSPQTPPAAAEASVSPVEPSQKAETKSHKKKKQQDSDQGAMAAFLRPSSGAANNQDVSKSVNDNLKLGRLYLGIGSADDAIKSFKSVLAADPDNKEAKEGLEKAKKMKLP